MNLSDSKTRQYEDWVRQWSADLYRFAYRLCGQAALAEDLVQETFYHAWRSMHQLKEVDKARSWLFRILRFRHAHWVRDHGRQPQLTGILADAGESGEPGHRRRDDGPLDQLVKSDLLQQALDILEEPYRQALLLVYMQGLTCREAAEELDLPVGTVLSRIHRARQMIRKRLEEKTHEKPQAGHESIPALRLRRGG